MTTTNAKMLDCRIQKGALTAVALLASTGAICQEKSGIVFDTGNKLLNYCEDRHDEPTEYCWGVVSGYADMLVATGDVCGPEHISRKQVLRVILTFLHAHPESTHLAASSLALPALKQAFPCKPQNAE